MILITRNPARALSILPNNCRNASLMTSLWEDMYQQKVESEKEKSY
jgi:hypothetical protein